MKTGRSQTLLQDYVRNGSESAFAELVGDYIGLVYSTALRIVDGDSQLAEDVTQMVFADLARHARSLTSEVMLGGWLHQHACNVARPLMRSKRRRRAREREAVEMNALQDHTPGYFEEIAPVLDEAVTELGVEDRQAILMRFFERRELRAVGEAMGTSEDAARMRISRALEKLHSLLKHRGMSLSVGAIGMALASETLTAAPAGLAAKVAASVLAGAVGAGAARPEGHFR